MNKISVIICIVPSIAFAECNVRSTAVLTHERNVGTVSNVVEKMSYSKCDVEFDLTVDGQLFHLRGEYIGWEQPKMRCNYAIRDARERFLLTYAGKFKTESITTCKEGEASNRPVKIGDVILENEVDKSPVDKIFKYQNNTCKFFTEVNRYSVRRATYNGVMCKVDETGIEWRIVDKW